VHDPAVGNLANGDCIDNCEGGSIGYRLSRTALNQLTVSLPRSLASEGSNVIVHAIHPGYIPTTMTGFIGLDDMDTAWFPATNLGSQNFLFRLSS